LIQLVQTKKRNFLENIINYILYSISLLNGMKNHLTRSLSKLLFDLLVEQEFNLFINFNSCINNIEYKIQWIIVFQKYLYSKFKILFVKLWTWDIKNSAKLNIMLFFYEIAETKNSKIVPKHWFWYQSNINELFF